MLELIRILPGAPIRAAVLDFDGTLSLVRGGWQGVMRRLMLDMLPAGDMNALVAEVDAAIHDLTGQATIHQMAWLAEAVARRGGLPEPAETYKQWYTERLARRIDERLVALRNGALTPDELLVPGARALLDTLQARGIHLILASGTDRADVLREARALAIGDYFGAHVYAPGPHDPNFSKRTVIERTLEDARLMGAELLVIGDGPVEIAEARAVGAVALGVAFDEECGNGVDAQKRQRLIAAGADLIIDDFSDLEAVMSALESAAR